MRGLALALVGLLFAAVAWVGVSLALSSLPSCGAPANQQLCATPGGTPNR